VLHDAGEVTESDVHELDVVALDVAEDFIAAGEQQASR
jgi:hypothetical protein